MKKIHFYSLHELKQNIKENFFMNATIKYKKRRCDKKTKFSFFFLGGGGEEFSLFKCIFCPHYKGLQKYDRCLYFSL